MPPPPSPGSRPDRAETAPSLDTRLEDVVGTIEAFASLQFGARASVGSDGDIVDAVAAGVNFLGEELDASFREIERRVADRTAELAIATRELGRRALHDELTGLPNRALFWEHLTHRLATSDRRQTGFAVLFLDVDDFKAVNDGFGHAAGDRLLVDVASRLRASLRGGDTAARVGGDEFVVLLDDVASKGAALSVAERLSEALRAPYEVEPEQRTVTASIGVALGPTDLGTSDQLVAAADAAMYDAKRHGAGRCVLYSKDVHRQPGPRRPGEPLVWTSISAMPALGPNSDPEPRRYAAVCWTRARASRLPGSPTASKGPRFDGLDAGKRGRVSAKSAREDRSTWSSFSLSLARGHRPG